MAGERGGSLGASGEAAVALKASCAPAATEEDPPAPLPAFAPLAAVAAAAQRALSAERARRLGIGSVSESEIAALASAPATQQAPPLGEPASIQLGAASRGAHASAPAQTAPGAGGPPPAEAAAAGRGGAAEDGGEGKGRTRSASAAGLPRDRSAPR